MRRSVQIGVFRVIVATIFIVAAGAGRVQTQANPDDEFKKIADAFSQAWGKGDAKAIAALHTKDAVRLAGNGQPAVVGTAALEKGFTEALAGPYKRHDSHHQTESKQASVSRDLHRRRYV